LIRLPSLCGPRDSYQSSCERQLTITPREDVVEEDPASLNRFMLAVTCIHASLHKNRQLRRALFRSNPREGHSAMSLHSKSGQSEALSKVAQVTIYFWIMKVLATTLGEHLRDRGTALRRAVVIRARHKFGSRHLTDEFGQPTINREARRIHCRKTKQRHRPEHTPHQYLQDGFPSVGVSLTPTAPQTLT
jgi:hypothetical protein